MTDLLPDGVEIDPVARTVAILGRRLLVLSAMRGAPVPAGHVPSPERAAFMVEMGLKVPRPTPRDKPEGWHFDIVAGENGWWIEMSVFPRQVVDGEEWEPSMYAAYPGQTPVGGYALADHSADEIIALLNQASCRPGPPPDDEDLYPGMGLEPGTWIGWDET